LAVEQKGHKLELVVKQKAIRNLSWGYKIANFEITR